MLVNPITSPADSWARSCRQNPSIAAPTSSFHIASRTLLHHGQIKECLYRLACDRILLTKLQNGSLGNTVVLHLILLQEMVLMCTHNYIWHIYMIIYVLGASHRLGSWWCRDIHQDLMLQRVAESYEAARVFFRSLIVRDSHIDSTQDSYGYGSIPINTIFMVGWTSLNPSYFDVNYRGTRFWPIAILISEIPFSWFYWFHWQWIWGFCDFPHDELNPIWVWDAICFWKVMINHGFSSSRKTLDYEMARMG